MSSNESMVGRLIMDGDKVGLIVNEIKSGTWSEEPLFNWTTSYEIKYADGDYCVMTSGSLDRLIKKGKVVLLEGSSPTTGVLPPSYPTGGSRDGT
jgi:roadblock/LC7 domain-containing protein